MSIASRVTNLYDALVLWVQQEIAHARTHGCSNPAAHQKFIATKSMLGEGDEASPCLGYPGLAERC